MEQIDDDAWIAARENAIERMWTEPLTGSSQTIELNEDELPY